MIEVITPIRRADPLVLLLLKSYLGPSLEMQHEPYRWTIGLPKDSKKRFAKAVRSYAEQTGAAVVEGTPQAEAAAVILIRPNWAVGLGALSKLAEIATASPGRSAAFAFDHGVDYHFATGLVKQIKDCSGVCPAGLGRAAHGLDAIATDELSFVKSSEPMWLRCVNGPEPPWEEATEVQKYFGCQLCGPLGGSR